MKNPCRECPRLGEDKNNPECTQCEKRVAYWQGLGSLSDMGPTLRTDKTRAVAGPDHKKKEEPMAEQPRPETTKVCRGPVCDALASGGVDRPLSDFGSGNGKHGRNARCRMCVAYDFVRRSAAKNGRQDPDPKAYATRYMAKKSGDKKRARGTAPETPPAASLPTGDAAETRAVATDLFTDGGLIVVLDFSARPDLYQKVADRGAWDILMDALCEKAEGF